MEKVFYYIFFLYVVVASVTTIKNLIRFQEPLDIKPQLVNSSLAMGLIGLLVLCYFAPHKELMVPLVILRYISIAFYLIKVSKKELDEEYRVVYKIGEVFSTGVLITYLYLL